jgi:hypothetical protein
MAMKRKSKKSEPKPTLIRVWTYPQAKKALPYISSIMGSVREHWLDARAQVRRLARLEKKYGRADRETLIGREVAAREKELALDQFQNAVDELREIEVFCVDPTRGLGVVPFVHDERLAWLLYDRFDNEEYRQWRYHDDPPEVRRPIAEACEPPPKELAV